MSKEESETKKCLICKPAGDLSNPDLSTEEIPDWSKREGNYSPYPKMISCDAKYALEDRDSMIEESPEIDKKGIELNMEFGEENSGKWVFYFAANSSDDHLKIKTAGEAYGQDENHGLVKVNEDGDAIFKLNCPQPYNVKGKTYCRHVHYLLEEDEIWSDMKTTRVICDAELEEIDKAIKEKNYLIVNALDFKYYDKEKIPGSYNLPVSRLDKMSSEDKKEAVLDFIKESIHDIKILDDLVNKDKLDIKDVPIIAYCAHSECSASTKLLDNLFECGVNNVLEYSGGMKEWSKERSFFTEDKDESEDSDSDSDSDSEEDSESSSSSDEDESEDSDDDTIEIVHDGISYLYDKETKEVYNDDMDVVALADLKHGNLINIKWKEGEENIKKIKDTNISEEIVEDNKKDKLSTVEEESSEEEEEEEEEESDEESEEEEEEDLEEEESEEESEESEEEAEEEGDEEENDSLKDKLKESTFDIPPGKYKFKSDSSDVIYYSEDKLKLKTKKDLKDIAMKLTEREGGSYKFPLNQKKYRTKTNLIKLISKCQGKEKKKGKFPYYTEDELYSFKVNELNDHVNNMIGRDKGSFKYALWNMDKNDIIDLITTCQGEKIQSGGCDKKKQRGGGIRKGYGWGFMF